MSPSPMGCQPPVIALTDATDDLPIGRSSPLGATVVPCGVNFSVFSRNALRVELLLFDRVDDALPASVIGMEAATNRTLDYWHILVPGLRPGQLYGFRAQGPFEPQIGMRFDPGKVLLDPYGRGVVVPRNYNRTIATLPGDNGASAMKKIGRAHV